MYIVVLKSEFNQSPWRVRNSSSSLNRVLNGCLNSAKLLAKRNYNIVHRCKLQSCRTGNNYDSIIIEVPNFIQSNLIKVDELPAIKKIIKL